MSEYQYYEWQTIDRLLTEAEQEAVNGLSSHIDVTASQAVVTYQWGDFKHEPRQVLVRYFDAFLYFANWGTRRLMFRFPKGLLDEEALAPYLMEEMTELSTEGNSRILEFTFEEEEPQWDWIEDDDDGTLSGLVSLRNDILEGDYRCLYLAWLGAVSLQDPDEFGEVEEPPVPAGLRKMTPALKRFAQFFAIDAHLIKSAAAASPDRGAGVTDAAQLRAISRLSREECDDFLLRLARGEAGLGLALRHKLQSDFKPPSKPASGSQRTTAELLETAERLKDEEAERRAIEAEERRIADLKKLAKREAQAWKDVEALLQKRHASAYDQAVAQLKQLRDLADYQKTRVEFNRRVRQLREQYKSRPAFIGRLVRIGLE